MTPHCWSSWSITSRGLVDLETTDIAVRRNEKGKVHGINARTWSSIKRKDRKERGFLIPSSSLATHSKAGHPKWFTFMCLYTKNKKAINNSLYEGVSCTLLLTQLFFSLPSPLSYLFPPWPRGNTRQICHWLDGSRYGEWFSNISLPPMLGISLWALFIILKWSLLHEPHQIKKKKKSLQKQQHVVTDFQANAHESDTSSILGLLGLARAGLQSRQRARPFCNFAVQFLPRPLILYPPIYYQHSL